MIVHYYIKGGSVAPCGYAYQKRLLTLDYSLNWDLKTPHHVTCLDCLRHRPGKGAPLVIVREKGQR